MRITRRIVVAALAAGGLLPGRIAAQRREMTLEELLALPMSAATLAGIRRAVGTPGMAVMWQAGARPPVFLADGLRAVGHAEPVTTRDTWHLGSITKSFTATLFARAVEAGVIGWDTPMGKVLPDVPRRYRALTAVELLSHHAGLPKDIPLDALFAMPQYEPGTREADARASRRKFAQLALKMKPVARPGTAYIYSNAGYVLAARMLEEATGLSWEALLRREVLDPLDLASAGFGPPGSAGSFDQPWGHDAGKPVYADNPAAMAPAGGLHMTLADLAAWLRTHRDKPALLRPESWRELHMPRFGSQMAMGWFVDPDGSLWHNGSNTRWYAEAMIEPRTGLIMAQCGNDMALFHQQRALLPGLRMAAMMPR
ncbi:MAG: serine hydrolase domain-containing protein [Novosphingobium sp.]|uniref:serine hydrolase domain-containing protein n=1 Tax=Novosphingobium sp. TaxID=1874826 RepID=UPI002737384D|nr:serine hydrolase domain-containing protein [Novosphingobium sp.]MDP3551280.1 serine hydrolase domain-containing protein [Novosphingobium sp.]